MYDHNLALMTGVDIAIPELQVVLHQPSIKEISLIGEADFFVGVQLLCLKKEMYIEDEALLSQTTNFQIFMSMLQQKELADKRVAVEQVLQLLLPNYKIVFTPGSILLNPGTENIIIDEGNFQFLQEILIQQFCLSGSGQDSYNPKNDKAKKIAQKLMQARQKVAAQKATNGETSSVFSQYLSILTIGLGSMGLNDLVGLTMYQLYDLIERYMLYTNWDLDVRSRMAGAKADKPLANWMENIHKK